MSMSISTLTLTSTETTHQSLRTFQTNRRKKNRRGTLYFTSFLSHYFRIHSRLPSSVYKTNIFQAFSTWTCFNMYVFVRDDDTEDKRKSVQMKKGEGDNDAPFTTVREKHLFFFLYDFFSLYEKKTSCFSLFKAETTKDATTITKSTSFALAIAPCKDNSLHPPHPEVQTNNVL